MYKETRCSFIKIYENGNNLNTCVYNMEMTQKAIVRLHNGMIQAI